MLGVAAYLGERGQSRSGLLPAAGFGIAFLQALMGLTSARPLWYFAPPLIVTGRCGVAFLVPIAVGQPLAAVVAAETDAFPGEIMASTLFRGVCSRTPWSGRRISCAAASRDFALPLRPRRFWFREDNCLDRAGAAVPRHGTARALPYRNVDIPKFYPYGDVSFPET